MFTGFATWMETLIIPLITFPQHAHRGPHQENYQTEYNGILLGCVLLYVSIYWRYAELVGGVGECLLNVGERDNNIPLTLLCLKVAFL